MNYREARPPQVVAAERAAALLDAVSAGEGTYEGVRAEAAAAYREAGFADAANFLTSV
jgi:hypothetical protein